MTCESTSFVKGPISHFCDLIQIPGFYLFNMYFYRRIDLHNGRGEGSWIINTIINGLSVLLANIKYGTTD